MSEVVNLKISDIDSAKMMIMVRQSKGKKDRVVVSEKLRGFIFWNTNQR
ncbi:hypothetical protein [Flavobacterium sp.]